MRYSRSSWLWLNCAVVLLIGGASISTWLHLGALGWGAQGLGIIALIIGVTRERVQGSS